MFKDSETKLNRALKQKLLATQNVDDYENRTVVSANKFYKQIHSEQYNELQHEMQLDLIETKFFIGTKTMKFISDKKAGYI